MTEPLILTAALHEKMWGGTALRDVFGFDIPSETTGEAWLISGHKNGTVFCEDGRYAGKSIAELWQEEPQLFGNTDTNRPFPLLVKLLDAHQDLSVQVHPDDAYAGEHAGELGKTESWYIVAAEPGAEIYYGHTAQTKAEFDAAVDAGDWDKLLRKVPVKAGDFFYVPAGTLHALGAGVLALETQQSSDVTYRVYDFDRVDAKTGELRELHLADAKNVTTVPFVPEQPQTSTATYGGVTVTTLVESPYFNVYKWDVDGRATLDARAPYLLATVIDGTLDLTVFGVTYPLHKGQSFILPNDVEAWTLQGEATLITSTPGPKSM
ncbi:mannose-6-phosphate isomerase, class I [Weissella cibaria]|uniref:mannose-6-phosphate isomerase, class I n=1 Tax=Weissella cibaria TaxID=137591 RepID=UPI0015F4DB65|nr:mannose-6-phosphate isomerase, class I [Weissella cibaria]MBA5963357.1 mannose-6-phosphate isomerase, class I [Weissella cibaria]